MRQPARADLAYLSRSRTSATNAKLATPLGLSRVARAQLDVPLWHLIGDGCESSYTVEATGGEFDEWR